jgi:hypothetical protein
MAQKITLPSAAPEDNADYQANRIEKTEDGSGRFNYIGYTFDNRIDFEIWSSMYDLTVEEV